MKLLQLTTRYFLGLLFILFIGWSVQFYFSMQHIVYEETDEYLSFHEHDFIENIRKYPNLLNQKNIAHSEFEINKITPTDYTLFQQQHPDGLYENTEKFIPYEKENETFRQKKSVFQLNGEYYSIITTTTRLKPYDVLHILLKDTALFFLVFFVLIFVLHRLILQKLWAPFYHTLNQIKQYKLDKEIQIHLKKTRIKEFEELNNSIQALLDNNLSAYKSQKQFTENASHEMQTPVGIIQSKMDLLMESPDLSPDQAFLIESVHEQLERLARLNKALLLLAKIENHQFPEGNQSVSIDRLIVDCYDSFSDLAEFKQINVSFSIESTLEVCMNEDLARIMLNNLLKNAINHNHPSGSIEITVAERELRMANTGQILAFDPGLLFERFQKQSQDIQSNGLGLSIVKKITDLYSLRISYAFIAGKHTLSIFF